MIVSKIDVNNMIDREVIDYINKLRSARHIRSKFINVMKILDITKMNIQPTKIVDNDYQ